MSQLLEKLNKRYACKQFTDQKIPQKKLDTILEAMRLSPSSFGFQPWKFVIVEDPKLREKLVPHSWNQEKIKIASHLIVLCRKESITQEQIDHYASYIAKVRNCSLEDVQPYKEYMSNFIYDLTKEEQEQWMSKQVYIALSNLLTAAALEDIDSCPVEGFVPAEYDRILNLSAHGLKSVVVALLGYHHKDDFNLTNKKVRFPHEEVFLTI